MRRRFGMAAASAALLAALVALPAGPAAAVTYEEPCPEFGPHEVEITGSVSGQPAPGGVFAISDLTVTVAAPFLALAPLDEDYDAILTLFDGQTINMGPVVTYAPGDSPPTATWGPINGFLVAPDAEGTDIPIAPEHFSFSMLGIGVIPCPNFGDPAVPFAEVTVTQEAGPEGPEGPEGPPGADGAPGADGPPGPPGSDGEDGADGADGRDGADGADGVDGADGADGADGVAAGVAPRAVTATPVGAAPTFTG